jgi:YVTN family beta-propeller protein
MRIRRIVQLVFVAAIQLSSGTAFAQQPRFKALAFYSEITEGDHVQFAHDAVKFLTDHAASEHFAFDATTRWEDLNDKRLQSYQLVIWLNESPIDPNQRHAFERYIGRGGAWLGFHAAGYNDKDTNWPWFVEFLGGIVFDINSWPPLPARLRIDDRVHPVTAGLPADFESPANEWYVWKPSPRLNSDVRVLATFDPSNYPIGFKDILTSGDLPVVWTNTKYKMLYMNMGHGGKIFTSTTQNQLIDNAVNWLGTGAAQTATPQANGIRVSPNGIALNPQSGKFYAVNTQQDTVTVLDANGRFLTKVQVGREPGSIAVDPDTNRVYVANSGSDTITVIDGTTDRVIANITVGDLPYTVAVNRIANKVYVSRTFSDLTVIIDGKTNAVHALRAGAGDAVAAVSVDHKTYLIGYENPQATIIEDANDQISKIEAGDHPWAIAFNPGTTKAYIANSGSANVAVIDTESHATRLVNTGQIPCAVAVDSISGRVFVANYASNSVTVIDGVNDSVVANVNISPRPQAIAVDSKDHRVYVASMHSGTTTVIDGAKNSVIGTIETGKAPFAVAVNEKTHKAVTDGLDGELTVIDGTTMAASSPSFP